MKRIHSTLRLGTHAFRKAVLIASLGLGLCLWGCSADETSPGSPAGVDPASAPSLPTTPIPGGRLVVALRSEPQTFNPVTGSGDNPSRTVIWRMMGDLIHTNRVTLESEAALAESWTASPDGRRFTLDLRRDVKFSDGHPLDADDVVFTFQVYLDEKVAAPNRSLLIIDGQPIRVKKLGTHRLEFQLAKPYAVGVKLFDSIAILPQHLLVEAYAEERFSEAWGLATPGEEIAGLGPFRLRRYVPGERLELEKNPHYWKLDAAGRRLPYLDEIVFLFVPNEEARVARFQSGEIHLIDRLGADAFNQLEGADDARYAMHDLGASLDFHFLFFNLNHVDAKRLPRLATKQAWFRSRAFRQAVSAAIDRQGMARLVYRGRATPISSHVTSGNRLWHHPGIAPPTYDPEKARELLHEADFSWNDAGALVDPDGEPVAFSILTSSSNQQRLQMAVIIQEDLRRIGIEAQVVQQEFGSLVERLTGSFEYEACLLGLVGGSDPNQFINVWRSDGGSRFWRLTPGDEPPWQVELDRLMLDQMVELDPAKRKSLYDRVQEILAREEPYVLLVSPNVLVGAHRDLARFDPAVIDHPTLWNADELFWNGR